MISFDLISATIYAESAPTDNTAADTVEILHKISKSKAFELPDGTIVYERTPCTRTLTPRRFVADHCREVRRVVNPNSLRVQGFTISTKEGAVIDLRVDNLSEDKKNPYFEIRTVRGSSRYEGDDTKTLAKELIKICKVELKDIPKMAPLW